MHGEPSTHISHEVRHFGLVLLQAPKSPIPQSEISEISGFGMMIPVGSWATVTPAAGCGCLFSRHHRGGVSCHEPTGPCVARSVVALAEQ